MTTILSHFDLTVEREGSIYTLTQVDTSGNEERIALHQSQISQLAEHAGVTKPLIGSLETPLKPLPGGNTMHQLNVEQAEDGTLWITQTRLSGMGGTDVEIELHPTQAVWLASKLQSTTGHSHLSEEDKLSRRLLSLRERIAEFACDDAWDEVVAHCAFGLNLREEINRITDLADEFLIESGKQPKWKANETEPIPACSAGEATPVTAVTHNAVTDRALRNANAERQRRYRERQKQKSV